MCMSPELGVVKPVLQRREEDSGSSALSCCPSVSWTGVLLKLELGWWPASAGDPPVSIPTLLELQTWAWIFMCVPGTWTQVSMMVWQATLGPWSMSQLKIKVFETKSRAGEMAQCIQCLLTKNKDQSSDSQRLWWTVRGKEGGHEIPGWLASPD